MAHQQNVVGLGKGYPMVPYHRRFTDQLDVPHETTRAIYFSPLPGDPVGPNQQVTGALYYNFPGDRWRYFDSLIWKDLGGGGSSITVPSVNTTNLTTINANITNLTSLTTLGNLVQVTNVNTTNLTAINGNITNLTVNNLTALTALGNLTIYNSGIYTNLTVLTELEAGIVCASQGRFDSLTTCNTSLTSIQLLNNIDGGDAFSLENILEFVGGAIEALTGLFETLTATTSIESPAGIFTNLTVLTTLEADTICAAHGMFDDITTCNTALTEIKFNKDIDMEGNDIIDLNSLDVALLTVDNINEHTLNQGVIIDGLRIRDGFQEPTVQLLTIADTSLAATGNWTVLKVRISHYSVILHINGKTFTPAAGAADINLVDASLAVDGNVVSSGVRLIAKTTAGAIVNQAQGYVITGAIVLDNDFVTGGVWLSTAEYLVGSFTLTYIGT